MPDRLIIKPSDWKCKLENCPPGFFVHEDALCFKSEYCDSKNNVLAYWESGATFVLGNKTEVQPVQYEWDEEE